MKPQRTQRILELTTEALRHRGKNKKLFIKKAFRFFTGIIFSLCLRVSVVCSIFSVYSVVSFDNMFKGAAALCVN